MYAVNVTQEEDIVKSITFAKQSNLRLVVKSTGHDFLQRYVFNYELLCGGVTFLSAHHSLEWWLTHDLLTRSTGYGSLSIWLHHFRGGFTLNDYHPGLDDCLGEGWNGSTLTIKGSYAWSDMYPAAKKKGVILVGGNNVVSSDSSPRTP